MSFDQVKNKFAHFGAYTKILTFFFKYCRSDNHSTLILYTGIYCAPLQYEYICTCEAFTLRQTFYIIIKN